MMTCKEVIDFLMDYVDGDLPPDAQAIFEKHLAVCPPCVAYLHTYKAAIAAGKQACCCDQKLEQVPEDLVKAILAARSAKPPA